MIALLVNPAAGGGRGAAHAARVTHALALYGTVRRFDTTGPGDERRQARVACDAGAQILAVVGGDGTLHHATRGLLDAGAPIPLAPFSAGTGNDFVKALGLPAHDAVAMAARIDTGITRRVDIGMVDSVPFLNAAGFGFDVDVLQRMRQRPWLRGTAAYVITALQALLGYRGFTLAHAGVYEEAHARHTLMLVCANGRSFGGAFRIAPTAAVDDGQLEFVHIAHLPPHARPVLFLRAVRGTHLPHAAVRHAQASSAVFSFRTPPTFEADGELYTAPASRVEISLRPNAITVIA